MPALPDCGAVGGCSRPAAPAAPPRRECVFPRCLSGPTAKSHGRDIVLVAEVYQSQYKLTPIVSFNLSPRRSLIGAEVGGMEGHFRTARVVLSDGGEGEATTIVVVAREQRDVREG